MQRLYLEGGVALNSFFADLFHADDTLASLVISADKLTTGGIFAENDVIAVENGERLIADKRFGTGDGVAETSRLFLADVGDVCKVRKVHDFIVHFFFAACEQTLLELRGAVEMIFHNRLTAVRDDENIGDAGADRFLHNELNGGLIHNGQHFLGHRFRCREHACAETRCGNDGFSDGFHKSIPPNILPIFQMSSILNITA